MSILKSRTFRAVVSVAGATTLALASVYLMKLMNRHVLLPTSDETVVRCVTLQSTGPRSDVRQGRPTDSDADHPAKSPIMRVDLRSLAQPSADVAKVEPLNLFAHSLSLKPDEIRIAAGRPGLFASWFSGKASADSRSGGPGGEPDGIAADSSSLRTADQVDQPPREPAGNAQPAFPERERRLGVEGEVVMEVLIDENGRVIDVRFISGPEAFRQAVSSVVRSWRFEPARHRGRTVKVWAVKEVGFTLRRGRS